MSFDGTNIIHLEESDFKNNKLVYHGMPVKGTWIVMVQGNYCHYCTKMKPTFVAVAKKFGMQSASKGPVFATIRIDGGQNEQALTKILPKITGTQLSGVPAILKFEDGVFSAMAVGGKNEPQLVEFMRA